MAHNSHSALARSGGTVGASQREIAQQIKRRGSWEGGSVYWMFGATPVDVKPLVDTPEIRDIC